MAYDTKETPVVKTTATEKKGIKELAEAIETILHDQNTLPEKRTYLLTEKCWQLLVAEKMKNISKEDIRTKIMAAIKNADFNLYAFTYEIASLNK